MCKQIDMYVIHIIHIIHCCAPSPVDPLTECKHYWRTECKTLLGKDSVLIQQYTQNNNNSGWYAARSCV